MKKASSAIVASAAITCGLHCAVPMFDDLARDAELGDGAGPHVLSSGAHRASSSKPEGLDVLGAVASRLRGEWSAGDDPDAGSRITSSVTAPDGSRYVAGEFSGRFAFGGEVLTSRGGSDLFVAHILPDGTVAWVHAIGSPRTESGARISFEDGRVKLVAMSDGAVDCGKGPLSTWTTEAFFLCTFGANGAPLNGASFPTGRP
jgi:hypothetical protein